MNKKIIFLILAIVVIAIVFVVTKSPATAPEKPNEQNNNDVSMITVFSPKEGDTLDATNGFDITGQAARGWYFEATAPFTIYSKDGSKLVQSYVTAEIGDGIDWMKDDFTNFKASVKPFLTKGSTEGYIIFENSNPSDNEGFRKSLNVNVKFLPQETQTIKIYYGNTEMNPGILDCSKVFPVNRLVPKTTAIGALSMESLLLGPTEAEKKLGYISAFENQTGFGFKSLKVENEVAIVDFSILPSGGSCLVGQARSQIEQTLKQFSTVKSVDILLNGSEDEALQP